MHQSIVRTVANALLMLTCAVPRWIDKYVLICRKVQHNMMRDNTNSNVQINHPRLMESSTAMTKMCQKSNLSSAYSQAIIIYLLYFYLNHTQWYSRNHKITTVQK